MYVHQYKHTKVLSVIYKLHPPMFFNDKNAMPKEMSMCMWDWCSNISFVSMAPQAWRIITETCRNMEVYV